MYYSERPISISSMGPWAQWSPPFGVLCKLGEKELQQLLQDSDKEEKQERSHKYLDKQSPLILVCNVSILCHLL